LGFLTGILFLLIEPYKYDPFVRFHALQSILLSCFYGLIVLTWDEFVRMVFTMGLSFLIGIMAPLYLLVRLGMILLMFFSGL
jgi:uncharacterized membrane protein